MRFSRLNQKDNKKLIVFFNGWGADRNIVEHLKFEDFDVLEINDYRKRDVFLPNFSKYTEKYLLAWSMGVYVSNLFKDILEDFDKKIAIAGTSKMIDDKYGIPKSIYSATLENFNEETCRKFIINMGLNPENYTPQRSIDELQEELCALSELKIDKNLKFDRVIIPKRDIIVPYKNQLRFWQEQKETEIETIISRHYVFNNYNFWHEFLC